MTLDDLKEYILNNFDPDDVLDALDLSTEDLLDAFEDRLIERAYKFVETEEEVEDGSG